MLLYKMPGVLDLQWRRATVDELLHVRHYGRAELLTKLTLGVIKDD